MNVICRKISPQSWKRLSLPNVRVNLSTSHFLCPDIFSRTVSIQSFTVFFVILCTSNMFWINKPTPHTVTLLNCDGSIIIIIQEFSKYNSGRQPRYTHLLYAQVLQYISVTRNNKTYKICVCVKLPVTTVLVLQFRTCGTIPPHRNTAAWNLQEQLLLCLLIEYFLKVSKFAQVMYHGCVPLAMPK